MHEALRGRLSPSREKRLRGAIASTAHPDQRPDTPPRPQKLRCLAHISSESELLGEPDHLPGMDVVAMTNARFHGRKPRQESVDPVHA